MRFKPFVKPQPAVTFLEFFARKPALSESKGGAFRWDLYEIISS